jgi:hypothetical protein
MKKNISEYGRLHEIKNENVDRLKSDKKPCKYFYKLYLENIKESPEHMTCIYNFTHTKYI